VIEIVPLEVTGPVITDELVNESLFLK